MKSITDLFEYVDGKLFWRVTRGRVRAGSEAGVIAKNGRRYVQVYGKKNLTHRIIWAMHNEELPKFLDHIDGDPLNNRIENLRPATKSQNAMNRKVRSDSNTGVKGICIKGKRFGSSIFVNGSSCYLGTFDTPSLAQTAYATASKEHFKEFSRV